MMRLITDLTFIDLFQQFNRFEGKSTVKTTETVAETEMEQELACTYSIKKDKQRKANTNLGGEGKLAAKDVRNKYSSSANE